VRIMLLIVALSLAAAGLAADQLSLAQGSYRLTGRCSSMRDSGRDELPKCAGVAVIMTRDPSRPNFIFARAAGEVWIFQSSGDAKRSNDGNTATYPISRFLDGKRAYELLGECAQRKRSADNLLRHSAERRKE